MDDSFAMAYQYRGLTALALGDPQKAVNDLYFARNLSPDNFDISLSFGLAMWASGNTSDAYLQVDHSEELARTEKDLARVYYYRAQIAHELSQFHQEDLDWQALLKLPSDVVPADWIEQAVDALGLDSITLTPAAGEADEGPTPTLSPKTSAGDDA